MATNAARQRADNTEPTPLKLVKNDAPTLPQRPCDCGCGATFTPNNYRHRYVEGHRYDRFINDKRDATYDAVWALAWGYGGLNKALADKVAQTCMDFGFTRTCRALETLAHWKYDCKAKRWVEARGAR